MNPRPGQTKKPEKPREEYALVLDFLKNGYPFDPRPNYKKTPVIQAIGTQNFTLLELAPRTDIYVQTHQKLYIGQGKRDEVNHIVGTLPHDRLTSSARAELEFAIESIVSDDAERFVAFYNNAQPLNMRMHQLELLPGLGKKHMWEIIEARDEKQFESFDDIKQRVKLMPNPKKAIIKRILSELEGLEKHMLFVRHQHQQ